LPLSQFGKKAAIFGAGKLHRLRDPKPLLLGEEEEEAITSEDAMLGFILSCK